MVTREDASGFLPRPLTLLANQHSRRGTANGDAGGAGAALPWQRGGRACGGKSEKRSPMAEPRPGPPSAPSAPQCSQFPPPSAPQCSQLPPPSLEGLIPPSHFVLRPRSLGAELEAERGRVHELEVELKALKGQSQHLGAELEAEKSRSHRLEVELEAEKGRSQQLEAELKTERGRSQVLRVELDALRGRGQRLEAELDAEKGRSQILEMELETLRGRGLGPEGAEPSPEQVLLGRWRQKVFQLLLQVSLQRGQELRLQGQVRSLGAAVAAGSRQVSLLELRLRQGEQERQVNKLSHQSESPNKGVHFCAPKQVSQSSVASLASQSQPFSRPPTTPTRPPGTACGSHIGPGGSRVVPGPDQGRGHWSGPGR
ncbi:uncharacterized protein LOC102061811 isoform X10 [Zonotrichia albicollis]|uniref:uncharacterized protein LOC102061811 isoform X10 n=1 Tax=Zonotrichia albicollis TaxID=44394 RepID=UPI003D80F367